MTIQHCKTQWAAIGSSIPLRAHCYSKCGIVLNHAKGGGAMVAQQPSDKGIPCVWANLVSRTVKQWPPNICTLSNFKGG